jgi:hypothetical protein
VERQSTGNDTALVSAVDEPPGSECKYLGGSAAEHQLRLTRR